MLAAPAVIPTGIFLRTAIHASDPGLRASGLAALFAIGVPGFVTHWARSSVSLETVRMPMVYAAWFAPMALVNANWRRLGAAPQGLSLILAAGAFAALAMFPGFWQFRWMYRLLPYHQLAALLLGIGAVAGARLLRRPGFAWTAFAVVFSLRAFETSLWRALNSLVRRVGRERRSAVGI